jgi:hypothetical protein
MSLTIVFFKVSKTFNERCGSVLTRGLELLRIQADKMEKRVESSMPRRNSEKFGHPLFYNWLLARDVVTKAGTLKWKLYTYMFEEECPFIPGKVGLLA